MSDRDHDADTLRRLRYSPEVERGLKQFQKYANASDRPAEYKVRYEYTFTLSPDKRAAVDELVNQGFTFVDAYYAVTTRTP